jgi:NADPH-dependent curcumin reductase CurA|tara:strand:+ start:448 stop:1443 length:996 start_codon:yes stop_codon:yes gene_type:complete
MNKKIVLKKTPIGVPEESDFELIESPIPELGENEILTKTIHLSLDPYIRGVITGKHIYSEKVEIGDTIVGRTIAEVIDSKNSDIQIGETIMCSNGWQEYGISDGEGIRKIDSTSAPLSTNLGILGMPGLTAYAGLLVYGEPKKDDVVVVSAASGPVGCMVGQIAQIHGAKAIGIAGSDEKCSVVKEKFGFAECINYKTENLSERIKEVCPDGLDIYFDNVGGETLDIMTKNLAMFARIVLCGFMTQYNLAAPPPGPNLGPIVGSRASIKGVVVYDHYDKQQEFITLASQWLEEGKINYIEDEVFGIENTPMHFCSLMRGENFGKTIITLTN